MVNKNQIKKLDKLFQEQLIKENPISIFGGKTEVIHHFITKGAGGLSTRWYRLNGIPLTNEQHNKFHSKQSVEMEMLTIRKMGEDWRNNLRLQKRKIVKNPNYMVIKNHILGEAENYVY